MEHVEKLRQMIKELNYYSDFYEKGNPLISDKEWDNLYFNLVELENMTGIYFPDSPSQTIHYETVNQLKKVEHNHPMLSLDKTKDWGEFVSYFSSFDVGKSVCLMLKMDGLTCSLKYKDGKLVLAETRGDGKVGEDITHNARVIKNIPQEISYKEELVIDGEIICNYFDFETFSSEYKNPRNFAAGSVRLLNSKECGERNLTFIAWSVEKGFESDNSLCSKLDALENLGFQTVPYVSSFDWDAKDFLIDSAKQLGYPIDGLVARFDDIAYGRSLGATEHHIRSAYAFKFYDEEYETKLLDIEWSMGRTGQLCPIAVFETIDIDGTEISRASLSNISVMKQTLGELPFIGQEIIISKRNQIIPKVEKAKDLNGDWING